MDVLFTMVDKTSTRTKGTLPILKWETRRCPPSTGHWQMLTFAIVSVTSAGTKATLPMLVGNPGPRPYI